MLLYICFFHFCQAFYHLFNFFMQLFLNQVKGTLHITFPAVYDGLPARIRACEARPGLANCGGVRRGNGAKQNDLAERSPPTLRVEGRRRRSVYNPVRRSGFIYISLVYIHQMNHPMIFLY